MCTRNVIVHYLLTLSVVSLLTHIHPYAKEKYTNLEKIVVE